MLGHWYTLLLIGSGNAETGGGSGKRAASNPVDDERDALLSRISQEEDTMLQIVLGLIVQGVIT